MEAVAPTAGTWLGVGDVIAGYVQAYDDRDPVALRAVLHDNCRITVSAGRFRGQEFIGADEIVTWLTATWPDTPPCLHLTGNLRVVEHDDRVTATSDYLFVCRTTDGGLRLASSGRYTDRLVTVAGRFVLAERDVGPPETTAV